MTDPSILLEIIGARLGRSLDFEKAETGGCISESFTALAGAERVFVKTGPAEWLPLFQAEAEGLAALAAAGAHRVPEALNMGEEAGRAWLVLDWLDLRPIKDREDGALAGRALAELHRQPGESFGWSRHNFIGSTLQENDLCAAWPLFWAKQRLRPQLALAEKNGHPREFIAMGRKLAELVPAFFVEHKPTPSLLHGDLWHGNAAMAGDRPSLFDPAVYYGDREADVAMTELFGGFPGSFYAAYREAYPLAPGFETRKQLYNLYHVLNHLNLFGRGYLNQAERMVRALLAEVQR